MIPKLAIVVAHDDKAEGARMIEPFSHVSEYEYSTLLSAIMIELCEDKGIWAEAFLRDQGGISGAYSRVREFNPHACIEPHFNGFHDPSVRGTLTLFGDRDDSFKLACRVHDEVRSLLGRRHDQWPGPSHYSTVNQAVAQNLDNGTDLPCILLEPFFGSNKDDCILALRLMRELAGSIIDGFNKWYLREF